MIKGGNRIDDPRGTQPHFRCSNGRYEIGLGNWVINPGNNAGALLFICESEQTIGNSVQITCKRVGNVLRRVNRKRNPKGKKADQGRKADKGDKPKKGRRAVFILCLNIKRG